MRQFEKLPASGGGASSLCAQFGLIEVLWLYFLLFFCLLMDVMLCGKEALS